MLNQISASSNSMTIFQDKLYLGLYNYKILKFILCGVSIKYYLYLSIIGHYFTSGI